MKEVEVKLHFSYKKWEKFMRIMKDKGEDRHANRNYLQSIVQTWINDYIRDYVFEPKQTLRRRMQL